MKITIQDQQRGAELMQTLIQKAWDSAAFKDQLIKNPVGTIEQVTGKELTLRDNKKIVVEDQSSDSVIYFNIPAKMNLDELELTEEQLELVAGGVTPAVIGFGAAIAVCWAVSHL